LLKRRDARRAGSLPDGAGCTRADAGPVNGRPLWPALASLLLSLPGRELSRYAVLRVPALSFAANMLAGPGLVVRTGPGLLFGRFSWRVCQTANYRQRLSRRPLPPAVPFATISCGPVFQSVRSVLSDRPFVWPLLVTGIAPVSYPSAFRLIPLPPEAPTVRLLPSPTGRGHRLHIHHLSSPVRLLEALAEGPRANRHIIPR